MLQILSTPREPRLLDQIRDALRRRHYSYRTVLGRGAQGVASPVDSLLHESVPT